MADEQKHDFDAALLAAQREHWTKVLQAALGDPDAYVTKAWAEAKLAQIEEQLKELTAKGRGEQAG